MQVTLEPICGALEGAEVSDRGRSVAQLRHLVRSFGRLTLPSVAERSEGRDMGGHTWAVTEGGARRSDARLIEAGPSIECGWNMAREWIDFSAGDLLGLGVCDVAPFGAGPCALLHGALATDEALDKA